MTVRSGIFAGIAAGLCLALTGCNAGGSATEGAELRQRLAALEQRKAAIEDLNAIKRLQRAYGYYLDAGLWDEVADLFADEGSIEIGLDGVYRGKQRVREYLYALGGGRSGLSPGQLNEHMQLMPVITLDADGRTARGTWRAVILAGRLGENALWGEGPYENEYVKENGVWKIAKLHWYQTLAVPYEGGWAKHADVNGGEWVGERLTPDAPPSIAYKSWPGTFVPEFHFVSANPFGAYLPPPVPESRSSDVPLARRAAALARDVQLLQDQYEIENLQRIYGYYIDKGLWQQAADLFADDGEMEIDGRGAYVGKARVLDYLRAIGPEGPQEGRLFENMQLQPVIHVAPDGRSAHGRWRLFAQLAQAHEFHEWGVGVYENEYVKEDGVWKIGRLHLFPTMFTPYEEGWGKQARLQSRFEPDLAPDRAPALPARSYEDAFVAPFHYPNPVTGKPLHDRNDHRHGPDLMAGLPTAAAPQSLEDLLLHLEQRIGRLQDVIQIENLQTIYGYHLATLEWDALAELFAADGTIEIALRGVYVGKASVRRNLDLYGKQGELHDGVLHNHMQYQPVIHVAPDGRTAELRSRAFSMLGEFGRHGSWMAGVYENEFVKVNGVWKFSKDQVMNTYFTPYDLGWKNLPERPAPGITASNPPDRPPSFHFDMFPKPFLPPYHYDHPVTGR